MLVPQGDGDGGEVEAGGGVEATVESRVEARRRGGDGSRVARGKGTGMTPGVSRPDRFPRENPAPAGPRHPCRGLPNRPERRPWKFAAWNFTAGKSPGSRRGRLLPK